MGDYPTLEASARATVGLQNPDSILGAVPMGGKIAVVYVQKQLGGASGTPVLPAAQTCPSTPGWALTNIDTGKPRKANTDIITIRIATTEDGINFTDVGAASGLQDPTSTALTRLAGLAAAVSSRSRMVTTACSSEPVTASTMIQTASISSVMPRRSPRSTGRRTC
jgi:hypothetical protein